MTSQKKREIDRRDNDPRCGVLYVVFGEKYEEEARRSIRSLRIVSPNLPVAVIANREWAVEPLPDVFVLRQFEATFRFKPLYIYEASPFERTLYIDADTVVARDLTPIFDLLDYYDLGVRYSGPQLNWADGLTFHPYASSQVLLFRKNHRVATLFSLWLREYDEHARRSSLPRPLGNPDDKYLGAAIAKSQVRNLHLPEFVLIDVTQPNITFSPPAIYHGRLPEMEMLHEEISGEWDSETDHHQRLWLPNIRGLLPAGVRRSDPLLGAALILRRLYNSISRGLRKRFKK